ncbi:hypothetical protein CHX26_09505 [Porphyrobacter sp. HT-58-2]|uniref:hypothetical protein n=1 Tax=Porphyrobacter sp. HT-58-2 TaxID=2023229 RepID=UPI000CDBB6AD|nr:hypothetical protein [Porphyrobacter sp. HT-58-2]AUX69702.1 hypothetical protein CHX26_09505 [Porphyrobacter sp. HT-58-2]
MSALHVFAPAAIIIAAAVSAAPVSAQQWSGTWNTRFGEFRLIQAGDYVYGDYGEGTIEGIIDPRTRRLRARFVNPNGSTGYAELLIQPDNVMFAGAFRWENEALPTYEDSAPDRRWAGRRTSSTAPARTRVASGRTRAAFIASAPPKYRQWIGANTAAASSTAAAQTAAKPLAERFPALKDYPASFRPRFLEVDLTGWMFSGNLFEGSAVPTRAAFLYGTLGLYAYCETAQGTRALAVFGNAPNRVLDLPRDRAERIASVAASTTAIDRNKTRRKFILDENCLNDNDSKISVQWQSNLTERNSIRSRDNDYGFKSMKIYLDQLPPRTPYRITFENGSSSNYIKSAFVAQGFGHTYTWSQASKSEWIDIKGTMIFTN